MLCFKELRKERGLSLKEMGDILGVSESCVSLYENGKREASYEVLRKASDFFGVSIDCLLRAERRPSTEHSSISVPLLQSVTLSQGQMDFTYTPQKKIIDFGAPSDYLYFKMHDTSMQPQIEKGDLVLIRRQAAVTNNDLAAVIFKDSPVTLRRIIKTGKSMILLPFNPKYESTCISEKERLIVLGKVTASFRKW